jgi:hypothetical protein
MNNLFKLERNLQGAICPNEGDLDLFRILKAYPVDQMAG